MEFGIKKIYDNKIVLCLQNNSNYTFVLETIVRWIDNDYLFSITKIINDYNVKIIEFYDNSDNRIKAFFDLTQIEDRDKLIDQLNSILIMKKLTE